MRKLKLALTSAMGLIFLALAAFVGVRAYKSLQGPQLEPWHVYAPTELSLDEIDRGNWTSYLDAEGRIFDSVRENVTRKLSDEERAPFNRYFEGSPVNPDHFQRNWNRSYSLEPQTKAVGAVVLLHGLTDSPYSLRHIASFYRDHGFAVVAIRIPGHGTTPAGLAESDWSLWLAAARLAVREARQLAPDPAPLQIVGFSNGGSLALKYALDAIEDPRLPQASRLILISPMVGVTAFARFAGLAGLPALLPVFAKAAWLSIVPEFNPFKYNSFPVNGARQSWRLTDALQRQIGRLRSDGRLSALPPILTFQSVLDFTVSTRAILSGLYEQLPANGSELVLFDINRNTKFGPLFRASSDLKISDLAPPQARRFRLTIVENAGEGTDDAKERVIEAGDTEGRSRALGMKYPTGVYSLSHVALPFPLNDSLYGLEPDGPEEFGVHLGALPLRGERGALIVSLEALVRMSSNPFFPFLLRRIDSVTAFKATNETSGEADKVVPAVQEDVRQAQPKGADGGAALKKLEQPASRAANRKRR